MRVGFDNFRSKALGNFLRAHFFTVTCQTNICCGNSEQLLSIFLFYYYYFLRGFTDA